MQAIQNMKSKIKLPVSKEVLLHFTPYIFHLAAFAMLLSSLFGIPIIKDSSFSCLRILPASDDPTWDADNPTGIFFGLLGSCYRNQGEEMVCTGTALQPSYSDTLSAVSLPAGLTLRTLPAALQITPVVLVVSVVMVTVSFPLLLIPLLSQHASSASPLRRLGYSLTKWTFCAGMAINFIAFVLSLSATLAIQEQFSEAADNFERLGRLSMFSSELAASHLQRAEVGHIFRYYYSAYAFQVVTLIASYAEWEGWPRRDEFMGSWTGAVGSKA